MNTYKTEPKTVTKEEVLFKNGITTVNVDEGRFLQYNDYFQHKTFYQCPKCKSLNNEVKKKYDAIVPVSILRSCEDCGYQHITDFTEEDND
ncbi:hypothetical protein RCG47_07155 [Staphylococcus simulans]|uniref:hypothetical protein n=1 Tax=Staphylococcus simulans TaxID=1286 RepID=UPI00280A9541|nr:hypothetical protein [Staphylococcus simulans]WMM09741.1 hypothetical protein RCG47_07155 [Staphylococcus simulans]